MAELGLFFGSQFGEGSLNLRKVKERIVAESVGSSRASQDGAFDLSAKGLSGLAVAGGGEDAYEAGAALVGWNIFQFAQQAGVVGFVVGIVVHQVMRVGCVARGMDSGRAF